MPDKTAESKFDYIEENEPQPATPMTPEELAALPPAEDGPAEPEGLPESDEEVNERRAARYSARGVWKGDKPPPSSFPVTEQETMDGSRAIVHLFQEIPGDTELKRHLLYGTIQFQHGPISEVGVNGGTIEGVIKVLQERLEGFQQGPFVCEENAYAINGLQQVLNVLALRTRRRREQGVEGTNAPHKEA